MKKDTRQRFSENSLKGALTLSFEGILAGALAGLAAIAYRYCLTFAEAALYRILAWIQGNPLYTAIWFAVLLAMGCIVARIIRWERMASGSGIPQVSGEVKGRLDPVWWRVMVAKFAGGTMSIFGGLSLGREGPSIQLGAMAAKGYSRLRRCDKNKEILLLSCGAGAGLAAAFNAPLAGILFVLEEISHAFDRSLIVAGTFAALTADFLSKLCFGQAAIFSFPPATITLSYYWLLIPLGILLGLAGAGYNHIMLKGQNLFGRIKHIPKEIAIAAVFAGAGILGLLLPQVLAGGHSMIVLLEKGRPALLTLFILLAVKFVFSTLSFGSGAPGGIFFPLLILGAYVGAIFGELALMVLPLSEELLPQFIILGMAGLFAGIVRAPLTGIVLITEMTGNMHRLLDIVLVCIISYTVANMTGSRPIYDSLLDNILKNETNAQGKH